MKLLSCWIWYFLFFIHIISARDWLVDKITDETTLEKTAKGTLLLSNTLISREFLIDPDFATIDFRDLHATNSSLLRCVKPEAIITLDGIEYNIGGVIPNTQCAYFNLHRNETNVSECGYQLWNGAILLCDYILTNQCRFSNKIVLELGAGIGLCSLIASRYASKIICTDHDNDLLDVIRRNIDINEFTCRKECIQIQTFDWKQFDLNEIDNNIEIILAADVIYDDDLTDELFNVFMKCFQEKLNIHSIYITIEKRINFYNDTLSVQCPAYDYFLEKLNELKVKVPKLILEKLQTDSNSIKQCTNIYERTNELILWHIYHSERFSS